MVSLQQVIDFFRYRNHGDLSTFKIIPHYTQTKTNEIKFILYTIYRVNRRYNVIITVKRNSRDNNRYRVCV